MSDPPPPNLARRYRVYKAVGVAGVIAIVVNFSGWLPAPYEGEPLSYELLVGVIVWIALLWAGIGCIGWVAYRGIRWLLDRRGNR